MEKEVRTYGQVEITGGVGSVTRLFIFIINQRANRVSGGWMSRSNANFWGTPSAYFTLLYKYVGVVVWPISLLPPFFLVRQ